MGLILRVFCNLCHDKVLGKKHPGLCYKSTTSNIIDNLKRRHTLVYNKAENEKANNNEAGKNTVLNYFGEKTTIKYKWRKSGIKWRNATQSLATWLCADSRPSYLVEDQGFRAFLSTICPEYEVPCADTMTKYIKEMYDTKKKENVEFCGVTSDGGTSVNVVSFQDTNVHYIDKDLFLNYHCLGVRENKEKHTAENYRENTDAILEEFNIKEKVVLFVTDNEPKMKAAFKDDERSGDGPHILHKSVVKGLNEVAPIKNIV